MSMFTKSTGAANPKKSTNPNKKGSNKCNSSTETQHSTLRDRIIRAIRPCAPPQSSSPSAHAIPQSKMPHRTARTPSAKPQLPNSKASLQQSTTGPATTSVSDESEFSGQHPPHSTAFGFHTHTTAVKVSHPLHCIRVSHPH
ncbi:hypothetical protein CRG98_029505 [Punica granatum]|uniref:Uncharacterized protein n=1 Tax=Punica granatum TaxID=22663 RepID=A0A2I0J1K1_PUNGR|nr:hypothetical protein CRG98_029505 [Punica granatum]